jgi:hypothetical protein
MSKGSKRRPGKGYAENWDKIFGNKFDQPLAEYGDFIPINQFLEDVESGLFMDCDGYGQWATLDGMGEYLGSVDEIFGKLPEGATHVMWYNK